MRSHSEAAADFIADGERTDWHNETLWWVRTKRDKASKAIDDWEALREQASQIKNYTLDHLGELLVQFEEKATQNGIKVHWAADAKEHNEIVHSIIQKKGVDQIVKSKSMLTEECHLNEYLAAKGIDVVDTDLGERIVQFRKEAPSHIVLPAIPLKKEDVGETFHEHLGTPKGNKDPQFLTEAARQHLREKFLQSKVAITGVNFAIAETGEFVVCTNEGNADMGAHLADIHIACMGIEKIIPYRNDLGVFLRLLARSATGQLITTYSSHFKAPRDGQEMHIVLVDNGRTKQLSRPEFRNSLKCIRCAACFNTCPVYRRSGGHSYHQAVAGPIGSILAPNFDMRANADLPFASTLCGSCSNVCPVKINIDQQLWLWRQEITKEGLAPKGKELGMRGMSLLFSNPMLFRWIGKIARWTLNNAPGLFKNKLNVWYWQREMPEAPKQSFQEWYEEGRGRRE